MSKNIPKRIKRKFVSNPYGAHPLKEFVAALVAVSVYPVERACGHNTGFEMESISIAFKLCVAQRRPRRPSAAGPNKLAQDLKTLTCIPAVLG
jgi:hypothetical protein